MSNVSEVRHLLVIADQKSRRIVSLMDDTYSIGRDPHSNILLYDRQVSRHHATLLRVDDDNSQQTSYRIIDGNLQGKKSTNGITINGQYCVSHDLVPGDSIRFGHNSQANYHIIADSAELALLKDADINTKMVDDFIKNNEEDEYNNVEFIDDFFLTKDDENEEKLRTMSFSKESNNQVSLADSNPNPIIEIDFDGNITYLNAAAKIKFSDLTQLQLSHPILKNLLGGQAPTEGTSFVREVDFEERYFEQHIHYLKENKCLRTYLFEVTKYRKRETKLSLTKNRYRFFFEQAKEGILVIDPQTKYIIETNQAYCKLSGYSMAEIIGSSLYKLLETDRDSFNATLESITPDNPYIIKDSFHRHSNGSLLAIGGQINLTTYQEKEVFCFIIRDIRDRKQAEEELQYKLLHDPLTNLPNRDLFKEQLGVALAHAQRHEHLLAIIFIDLDSFTHINNTLGHSLGDLVLQNFGERLTSCIRAGDTVTRWGSDEFIVLLPQIKNTEDTVKLAQRIFETLQHPFALDKYRLQIKCSIGIAIYPQDGETGEQLLKNADTALSRTKQQGRNHYQFYSPHLTAEAELLLRLENLLHQALEKKQFSLHYQPQLEYKTGKIVGMEALLRWETPAFGMIMPQKFLPLAAKTNLILHLSKWVLKTACEQNLSWQKEGLPPLPISVNLCAKEFQQPHLATVVASILDETGLDPQWLELELTELTLRQNLNLARKTLEDLQNLGVRIALDDFGRGFSSLGYIKQFSFRTIKLHQDFIRDLRGTSEELGLISAILAIGKGFNMRIVAEGVETDEQLNLLQTLECNEIQGYWFSRPLPSKEATELLSKIARDNHIDSTNFLSLPIIDS